MKWAQALLACGLVAGFGLSACGDDDDAAPNNSGGSGGVDAGGGTGGVTEGGSEAGADQVARGEYLVKHVAACTDCHTPRNADGTPDMSKFLAGGPFGDLLPGVDGQGMLFAPNLTPDEATGLGSWTDEQIKAAFLDGVAKDGSALVPVMPYYVLHNMSAEDADAIVAYLRSLPAVSNAIPDREPLPFPLDTPSAPVPVSAIPDTTLPTSDPNYEAAQRGRYLAGFVGVCMECHTEANLAASPPLTLDKAFAGNRSFPREALGLPPVFPETIYSANITPHENGIKGWTAQAVANALKQGVDIDNTPLCPPMPGGPMMAFGGLTDEDALAIGHYVTTLAPVDNGVVPMCPAPSAGDGGMSDGGAGDAGNTDSGSTDAATD